MVAHLIGLVGAALQQVLFNIKLKVPSQNGVNIAVMVDSNKL